MRSGRPLVPFELSEPIRKPLQSLANSRSTPHGLVRRAEIVLLAADGWPNQAIARCLSTSPATVGKWRKRFVEQGLMGLYDELRPGAPRSIDDEQVAAVVYRTLHEKPEHQTQWTVRSMAAASGMSKDTVHRIWRTFGLQPYRHETFKLSTDPFFRSVLRGESARHRRSVSESSRACPGVVRRREEPNPGPGAHPAAATIGSGLLGLGYVEGVTHDYKRHGTTTLFAALNIGTGQVMAQCKPRHRHQEFLQFLRHIETQVAAELDLHLVVDNYATHKHAKVQQWLARRPASISISPRPMRAGSTRSRSGSASSRGRRFDAAPSGR